MTFGGSKPSPPIQSGHQVFAKTASPLDDDSWQGEPRRSVGKGDGLVSIGILPRITNAECDFHGLGHRHEAASTGCYGKWDKLIGFAAALAIHSLLFLGVWRHEKIHSPPPSSAMTVSIVYLGPSSKGKAAEAGAPRAVSATPAKQKPTRTEAHVSAKPMVGPAQKSSSAVEAVPAVKAAPAPQVVNATEAPGTAGSTVASGPTN